MFIEEPGLNTKRARLYGRRPPPQRGGASVPHGHWQSSPCIAAPFLIEGAVTAEGCTAELAQVRCPELRRGDVGVPANRSTHKIARVAAVITARGATGRYLPPSSPDLTPSEMAFAKLKAQLRQAAARTLDELQSALAQSLTSFRPAHGQGFFRQAR